MRKTSFDIGVRHALEKFALLPEAQALASTLAMPSIAGGISAYNAPSGEKGRAGLFAGGGAMLGQIGGVAGGLSLAQHLISKLDPNSHALAALLYAGSLGAGGLLGSAAGGYAGHNIARATSDAPDYLWSR